MIRTLCALVFLAIGCSYEKDDAVDAAHAQMQGQVDQLRLALKERPASPLIEYKIGRLFAEYGLMDSARLGAALPLNAVWRLNEGPFLKRTTT